AFAVYRVAEARLFVAATSLGAVRLSSMLRLRDVLPVTIGFLVILLVSGAAIIVAIIVFLRSLTVGQAPLDPALMPFMLVPASLAALGVLAMIYYIAMNALVRQTILRRFCEGLRIENLATLDDVRQNPTTAPRRGEGLADSFEFGG